MKYNYTIDIREIHERKHFTFCMPEGFEPVTRFLNSDVGNEHTARFYLDTLKKVSIGEVATETISGNSCVITIKSDFVDIEDMFFDNKVVKIETSELILLIKVFLMEKKNFQKSLTA